VTLAEQLLTDSVRLQISELVALAEIKQQMGQSTLSLLAAAQQAKTIVVQTAAGPAAPAAAAAGNPAGPNAPAAAGAAGGGGGRGLATVAGMLARPFAALLSPLARLSTYLQATTSGMSVFQGALRVLAASLAPILLPVMFMLASGLIALADTIWNELKPKLGEWIEFIVTTGLTALEWFAEAVTDAASALGGFGDGVEEAWDSFGDAVADAGDWFNEVTGRAAVDRSGDGILHGIGKGWGTGGGRRADPLGTDRGDYGGGGSSGADFDASGAGGAMGGLWGMINHGMAQIKRKTVAPDGDRDKPGGSGGAVPEAMKGAMKDVLAQMKFEMAPKSQSMGLAAVGRNAQIAALNQSPFEAKMLDRISTVIAALEKVVNNTANGGIGP
jgi:hypothetical protein